MDRKPVETFQATPLTSRGGHRSSQRRGEWTVAPWVSGGTLRISRPFCYRLDKPSVARPPPHKRTYLPSAAMPFAAPAIIPAVTVTLSQRRSQVVLINMKPPMSSDSEERKLRTARLGPPVRIAV